MAKEKLKEKAKEMHGNTCFISGKELPSDYAMYDVHRKVPKSRGGKYTPENTVVLLPRAHLKHHGNYVKRSEVQEELKKTVNDRQTIVSARMKVQQKLTASQRKVHDLDEETAEDFKEIIKMWSKKLAIRDRRLKNLVRDIKKTDTPEGAIFRCADPVPGIGPNTIGQLGYWVDPRKAPHPSNVWSYFGLDRSAETRYNKKEPSVWKLKQIEEAKKRGEDLESSGWGGNKKGRTCLYQWAETQIKMGERSPYSKIYYDKKATLAVSNKITRTRVAGKPVRYEEKAWKDVSAQHRHMSAMRVMIKHFVADYWYVSRLAYGLPVSHPTEDTHKSFAEAHIEGNHRTVLPWERGWDKSGLEFKED